MSSVLACFLGQFGCYTKQGFCRNILCYVCGRCVKDFYGNKKKLKTVYVSPAKHSGTLNRDHFVRRLRLSVRLCVCPVVTLSW